MNILTFINMHLNEIQNAVIHNVSVDPTTGNKKGRVIFNTSENVFKYWDGSQWIDPASSGGGGGEPTEIVTVPKGGTGVDSLTLGEVLIGNGTDPVITKAIDTEVTEDSTNLINSGAVKTFVEAAIEAAMGTIESMKFKGTVSASGIVTSGDPDIGNKNITALGKYETGWTFRASDNIPTSVINTGKSIETGDILICIGDSNIFSASIFTVIQTNIDGAVTGPSTTVTNNTIAVFDSTTGRTIKELKDSQGNPITADYLENKFSDLFSISDDSDIEADPSSIKAGDEVKLTLTSTGVIAGVYGDNSEIEEDEVGNGDVIKIPSFEVDEKGRIVSAEEKEVTLNVGSTQKRDALNPTLTPVSGVCTWNFEHSINCAYPTVMIYEVSTGQVVITDVTTVNANNITITILSNNEITAGTYHCVVIG